MLAEQRQAMVAWAPGSDNYAPIIEYIVEFSSQFERETWYRAEIYNLTGLLQATDAKVGLICFTINCISLGCFATEYRLPISNTYKKSRRHLRAKYF